MGAGETGGEEAAGCAAWEVLSLTLMLRSGGEDIPPATIMSTSVGKGVDILIGGRGLVLDC